MIRRQLEWGEAFELKLHYERDDEVQSEKLRAVACPTISDYIIPTLSPELGVCGVPWALELLNDWV